jgi:putative ABC transport system permease protein
VIGKLVFENVRHKFMRTVLSVLLIAVPVTLILVIVGLSHGMVNDSKGRQRGVGADIILRPPNSSLMSASGTTIPEQLVAKLALYPHVTAAMGTVNQSAGGLSDSITGIDLEQMNRMSGGLTFNEGRTLRDPDDVLLDTYYAEQRHAKVGQSIKIGNHQWNVVGIVEPGKLSHIFCNIKVLQELYSTTGMISQIYLKLDDPKNTDAVIQELKQTLKDYPIFSMQELLDLISPDKVPYLSQFIAVIIGISVVISFAVVALSMYMAVLQRTREIGILKAIGASRSFILTLIVAESIVLEWWPIAAGIVLGAALLGALFPGLSAARHDPIEALAYE